MAGHSLNHIVLSSQELIALNKIIIMGCDAFKILEYPLTYKYFIASIYHVIEFSSIGVTLATPSADLKLFLTILMYSQALLEMLGIEQLNKV
jgi:hypothetical protein